MEFQAYLSQKYQGHESFLENVIFPIFGEDNFESAWDVELLDSEELRNQAARTGIRSILRCGTIGIELTPIEIFDITVSDRIVMDKNRVGVQSLIRRVMDTYSGAFMIIHYDNDTKWDWRFTFCQMKDKNEFTDSKRYTFLLGPNQSCRTAAQNFKKLADLHEEITIKDIVSAFDVEALSKEFFGRYKNHYERFVEYITGKRFEKEGGKFVEKTKHEPHPVYYPAFNRSDKAVRDYVKLTLGRIILCHFIQKKGWLGVPVGGKWGTGDEQFMKNLYLKATEAQKEDFLETVLEPFFFGGLDTDRRKSGDVFDSCVFGKVRVPYLNGGLFEKNHSDDIEVRFPKEYFEDLLEFFSEYNFTIDENDPNEAQVGIDPEMLSQIFENLLEDNKDKGAFYTPKEIVKYMCQESLIAYLVTKTGYDEDALRRFVHNPDIVVSEFSEDEKMTLLDAILSVKICDPAIGSGAFPIGLLNELVRCKEAIFGDEKGRADIKREIIRDNIYGVDIEKGAVDIARLRFWLSLVVDEEEPIPLPNLDFKIMQGNSLLEQYNGVDLSHLLDEQAGVITWGEEIKFRERLSKNLKEYFDCDDHRRKVELKQKISLLIKEKLSDYSHRGTYGEKVLDMTSINVEANDSFFLWHTWFADVFKNGGFDITIGNPPYISVRTKNFPVALKPVYQHIYELATGQYDMYVLFIEQCCNLLSAGGTLSFIVPTRLLSNESFMPARAFLEERIPINLYVDAKAPFETASVEANIMICSKGRKLDEVKSYKFDSDTGNFNMTTSVSRSAIKLMPFGIFPFVYSQDVIKLYEKVASKAQNTLSDFVEITRGFECGYKDESITTYPTQYKLIKAEGIKPYCLDESEILYCTPDFAQPSKFKSREIFECSSKLLTKFCSGSIAFAVDKVGYYNTNSVYNCSVVDSRNLLYLLAVLNCPISTFWFNVGYMNIDGLFPHIQKNQLEAIPILIVPKHEREEIEKIVHGVISNRMSDVEFKECVHRINRIIYDYIGLSNEEIAIIEEERYKSS